MFPLRMPTVAPVVSAAVLPAMSAVPAVPAVPGVPPVPTVPPVSHVAHVHPEERHQNDQEDPILTQPWHASSLHSGVISTNPSPASAAAWQRGSHTSAAAAVVAVAPSRIR